MSKYIPLAERMRPESLLDFLGQEGIVGDKQFLRESIKNDLVPSVILWGPPGCGKTTLARIIASETDSRFFQLSAVSSGVKELKEIINLSQDNQLFQKKIILFVDEIHRWNKAQQDRLLPYVEDGTITLIGATTENPSFEVNSALLSRVRVFVLHKLKGQMIASLLVRALKDSEKGLGEKGIDISKETIGLIAKLSNGDARNALNILEACFNSTLKITNDVVKKVIQKTHLYYDKDGEEHYNIISALHKSLRGNDVSASVYWLARMLEGGEDPIYIARRLLRFASEDIGIADNFALVFANSVFEACQKIGMPECNVHLTQLVVYLAKSSKNIQVYQAYKKAKNDVEEYGNLSVPLHLRNAPTKLMKDIGYGKNYKYTPLEDSSDQNYFPDSLKGRDYLC